MDHYVAQLCCTQEAWFILPGIQTTHFQYIGAAAKPTDRRHSFPVLSLSSSKVATPTKQRNTREFSEKKELTVSSTAAAATPPTPHIMALTDDALGALEARRRDGQPRRERTRGFERPAMRSPARAAMLTRTEWMK